MESNWVKSYKQRNLQLKNSLYYLLPSAVTAILPVISLPLFTRVLSTHDFGLVALCQAYAIFINGLANFGLSIGYERNFFTSSDDRQKGALLYSVILFVTFLTAIFGSITAIFVSPISQWLLGSDSYHSLLIVTYFSIAFTTIKTYYLIYLKNSFDAKSYVWYTIDESLIGFLISMVLVLWVKTGVIGIALGQLGASVIVLILLTFRFLKRVPFSLDTSAFIEAFKLSIPLTPKLFVSTFSGQVDKYLIGLLNTVGAVGIYSLGQKIANISFVTMTAIQNVWSPIVYKTMFEQKKDGGIIIGKLLTPFFYYSIAIAFCVSLFAEETLILLTSKAFYGATDVIIVFSMLYGAFFFAKQPQLIYAKKTLLISFLSIVNVAGNIALIPVFVKYWGATGAAWATLLAGAIYVFVTFLLSQKYYVIRWEYAKIMGIFLLFYVASVVTILLRNTIDIYIVRLMVKLLLIGLYFLMGVRYKILTIELYQQLVKNIPLLQRSKIH